MPAQDFVAMLSAPRGRMQHFFGATKWEKTSETNMTGYHQIRVVRRNHVDNEDNEAAVTRHLYGKSTTWYHKVEGTWKFAGTQPDIRWSEYITESVGEEIKHKPDETGG